jgi:hypothetical protein
MANLECRHQNRARAEDGIVGGVGADHSEVSALEDHGGGLWTMNVRRENGTVE